MGAWFSVPSKTDFVACETCDAMGDIVFARSQAISDLSKTADKGCRFCALFLAIWKHPVNADLRAANDAERFRICVEGIHKGPAKVVFGKTGTARYFLVWTLRNEATENPVTSESAPAWHSLGPMDQGVLSPDSDHSFRFMQRCLEACAHHDECNEACSSNDGYNIPEPSFGLPTRLLEIGADNFGIHLIETNPSTQGIRYAALSHCWGPPPRNNEAPPFVTTVDNLPEMKESIAWEKLPATFQDAVSVCRRLGFGHIWIDSLCILQPSGNNDQAAKEDWDREAGNMCAYYGNAYLTISGTGSSQKSERFLQRRYRYEPNDFVLRAPNGANKASVVRVQRCESGAQTRRYHLGPELTPLLDRGWCFQENVLSPRVLHFSDQETVYECRHGIEFNNTYKPITKLVQYQRIDTWYSTLDPQKRWRKCVEIYYPLKLTRDTDRLPALSGLASKWSQEHPHNKPRYFAGLWESHLAHYLCWYVNFAESSISNDYMAPSWSWASVKGQGGIRHPNSRLNYPAPWSDFKSMITLLTDDVLPESSANVFGAVKRDSSITISAPSIEMEVRYVPSKEPGLPGKYSLSCENLSLTARLVHPDTNLKPCEAYTNEASAPTVRTVRRTNLDYGAPFCAQIPCIIVLEAVDVFLGLMLGYAPFTKPDAKENGLETAYTRLGWFMIDKLSFDSDHFNRRELCLA